MSSIDIEFNNDSILEVPIYPATTNRDLYDYVFSKLPQGTTGFLILSNLQVPYDNQLINYSLLNKEEPVRFIQTQAPVFGSTYKNY
jgi:hypothetical protein